jgi:E3 ubiquitin-protein ligase RNF115/126
VMRVMPVIPPRNPVSPPLMIDGNFEVNGQCSICHDECELLQQIMKPSECDHCFHSSCLTPWIEVHSTCPNCRVPIQSILRKN